LRSVPHTPKNGSHVQWIEPGRPGSRFARRSDRPRTHHRTDLHAPGDASHVLLTRFVVLRTRFAGLLTRSAALLTRLAPTGERFTRAGERFARAGERSPQPVRASARSITPASSDAEPIRASGCFSRHRASTASTSAWPVGGGSSATMAWSVSIADA